MLVGDWNCWYGRLGSFDGLVWMGVVIFACWTYIICLICCCWNCDRFFLRKTHWYALLSGSCCRVVGSGLRTFSETLKVFTCKCCHWNLLPLIVNRLSENSEYEWYALGPVQLTLSLSKLSFYLSWSEIIYETLSIVVDFSSFWENSPSIICLEELSFLLLY